MDVAVKRGLCIALLLCAWSLDAFASITMSPSTLDAGTQLLGSTGTATGSMDSTVDMRYDLKLSNCTNGGGSGGTFALSPNTDFRIHNNPVTITLTYTATQLAGTAR